jgi:hypothetical protein
MNKKVCRADTECLCHSGRGHGIMETLELSSSQGAPIADQFQRMIYSITTMPFHYHQSDFAFFSSY